MAMTKAFKAGDNRSSNYGTSDNFKVGFNSVSGKFEIVNAADAVLASVTAGGILAATGFSGPLNGAVGGTTPNTVAGTTGTFTGGVGLAGTLAATNSAEKIVNGDGGSLTGWTAMDGVASLDSGHLRITKSASVYSAARLYQNIALVVGKRYKFTYTYVANGGGSNRASIHIGSLPWNSEDYIADNISPSTVTAYFTAVSAGAYIDMDAWMVNAGDSGGYTDWDNISLVEMGDGVFAGNVVAGLGLHVGGSSDPGDNNLLVDGNATAAQFRLSALNTAPANATDTGILGEVRIDASQIYICIATNTWKRAAIVTW